MTAISTEASPPISVPKVFGSDFVHSLKSQLKSMSGMAMGTARFMIHVCTWPKASASALPISNCTIPVSERMMPTV